MVLINEVSCFDVDVHLNGDGAGVDASECGCDLGHEGDDDLIGECGCSEADPITTSFHATPESDGACAWDRPLDETWSIKVGGLDVERSLGRHVHSRVQNFH